jgi:S-DNA-T family DNA segregation ATPase FtsK/SpoIIIE
LKEQLALNKELGELSEHWKEIMAQTNTYNNSFQTFTLSHIEKTNYGYKCRIYAPPGPALPKLEQLKDSIESGLSCKFVYTIPEHMEFAMAKIIKPKLIRCNKIPFTPVRVKPYELYIGVDIAGEPIIFNLNVTPMALFAGDTGSGKNGCIDHALTSWIHSCKEYDLELILFQGAKNDLVKYQDCEQVKAFIMGDFEELLIVLEYIKGEMARRSALMSKMVKSLKGDNLYHYNLQFGRLPYIIVVLDEFMSVMPDNRDGKELKKIKNSILAHLEDIGRFGRAVGVNYLIAHQKPEKELCPTFLKNMSTVRVCFGYTDDICPEIVLGRKYASYVVGLPERQGYFVTRGRSDFVFTTDLTGRIGQFIKPHLVTGHETIFDIINKKKNSKKQTQDKSEQQTKAPGKVTREPMDYSEVDMKPEDILKENIAKIPGWVPYNPTNSNAITVVEGGKVHK